MGAAEAASKAPGDRWLQIAPAFISDLTRIVVFILVKQMNAARRAISFTACSQGASEVYWEPGMRRNLVREAVLPAVLRGTRAVGQDDIQTGGCRLPEQVYVL
jgi:hypothetical protein